ncbi:MAG: hypothetical protein HY943_20780 [Gammaproteobacteria bacterium]|nr:hypothetical protein [Gammaproteobacteria bacterium]
MDATSLQIELDDTSAAGTFGGLATLAFAGDHADLADLSLTPQTVFVAAQINDYANPVLGKAGGAGSSAARARTTC